MGPGGERAPGQGEAEGVVPAAYEALLAGTFDIVGDRDGGTTVQQHLQDLKVVPGGQEDVEEMVGTCGRPG